mmetsp:Transcript_11941/g.19604  ORF Transcript_11941/g.19604 Transcript_11941/m.19604 type:complete len:234 (+) Transcript_11941:840-1541(+)
MLRVPSHTPAYHGTCAQYLPSEQHPSEILVYQDACGFLQHFVKQQVPHPSLPKLALPCQGLPLALRHLRSINHLSSRALPWPPNNNTLLLRRSLGRTSPYPNSSANRSHPSSLQFLSVSVYAEHHACNSRRLPSLQSHVLPDLNKATLCEARHQNSFRTIILPPELAQPGLLVLQHDKDHSQTHKMHRWLLDELHFLGIARHRTRILCPTLAVDRENSIPLSEQLEIAAQVNR